MSILDKNLQYHIKTTRDDIGGYVILPGDPGRVEQIAAHLENPRKIAANREYTTYTGTILGEKVSVTSTGIGGPSAAIAVEELVRCGAHTFIRVGTSGGMHVDVTGGDLVIATAAIRGDGASREYLTPDYPAVADFSVVSALVSAANAFKGDNDTFNIHTGVVQSKDSFYGETNPEEMPISEYLTERWDAYIKAGCLTSEMEAATIFSVALSRGVRAGAILTTLWNVERSKAGLPDTICKDNSKAIKCAVDAIKLLIESDKNKRGKDK